MDKFICVDELLCELSVSLRKGYQYIYARLVCSVRCIAVYNLNRKFLTLSESIEHCVQVLIYVYETVYYLMKLR